MNLGVDPEGRRVSYSISGPYFSVERDSGIVKLIRELDREVLSELETIITITGEREFRTIEFDENFLTR